jgi:hypothetical protein
MAKEVAYDEEEAHPQKAMKTFINYCRSLLSKLFLVARQALRHSEILKIARFFS